MNLEGGKPEDDDKPKNPERRAFLQGAGALVATGAIGAIGATLNTAEAQTLEKLPTGAVEVLDAAKAAAQGEDTIDLQVMLGELIYKLNLDIGTKDDAELGTVVGKLLAITAWNMKQSSENRVAFQEFSDSPGRYIPVDNSRSGIPLSRLLSLHVNMPALKKFLETPNPFRQ